MSWLAQNWVWIVVGVAFVWFFFGGRLGRHAGGHGGVGGLLGGLGHGGHGGDAGQPDARPAGSAPEAAVDPVGGDAVRTAQALTSIYQGKIYYFTSKENRERFEAAPQEYAQKAAGHPLRSNEAANERPRLRGGC